MWSGKIFKNGIFKLDVDFVEQKLNELNIFANYLETSYVNNMFNAK